MKHSILTIAALIVATALLTCSCTRNNSDIGPYFGTWALVEASGAYSVPGSDREVFLQFQSHTVCLRIVFTQTHSYDAVFGNWDEKNGTLTLDFPDHSDKQWYYDIYGIDRHSERRVTWSEGNSRMTLTGTDGTLTFARNP